MLCKEHPISTWNTDTYIMYELRMNCANLKLLTILQKHRCELEVMETVNITFILKNS